MKRIAALLLCIGMMIGTLSVCLAFSSSAESMYIRKIVSIVFDDSGSMSNRGCVNWAYANYALQSFCGLLNSDDQLYVTYMSDAENNPRLDPPRIDLSAAAVQRSVDAVRRHTKCGNTPYSSIDIAYQKLLNTPNDNENTQYWLVVISDGEFQAGGGNVSEAELNDKLNGCAGAKMPNGSSLRISYLAIGSHAAKPKANENNGLFVYESSGAADIIKTMSAIADQVSGRSRLETKNIKKTSATTVEIRSAVPLLNIAVLSQGTTAKIVSANTEGGPLSIAKSASVSYPENGDWTTDRSLSGGVFLIGNAEHNIGAGTYQLTFDEEIDLDDLVIMFEPALEVRMTLEHNGTEIGSSDELKNAMEGDTISLSYKICEMGSDREIAPEKLPSGTKYQIFISEDGDRITAADGKMALTGYTLKPVRTKITASVTIAGFSPIEYTVDFTPLPYVPSYTIEPSYGNNLRSVRYDSIAANRDLILCFAVYRDGVLMTDPDEVRALDPHITLSPSGNGGTTTFSRDGKIVFTPNAASAASANDDAFDVEATCTIADGTTACCSYTVLVADYQVIPVPTDGVIKKTAFFGNEVGASFYITRNGVKLGRASVENQISVALNESRAGLKTSIRVADDGTITVIPYTEEEHSFNWFFNYAYYWGLENDDVTVTLIHPYGSAEETIDVVGEDVGYILLNVILPLVLELAFLAFIAWWIYAYCAKPRFLPGATLYIADLSYGNNRGDQYHEIGPVTEVNLKQYNAFKYMIWPPTLKSKEHYVGKNLTISAGYGGSIVCHKSLWYRGEIEPRVRIRDDLSHPQYVERYIRDHDCLKINVITPYDDDGVHAEESIDRPNPEVYYVHTEDIENERTVNGIQVIENGTIFAYAIRINQ